MIFADSLQVRKLCSEGSAPWDFARSLGLIIKDYSVLNIMPPSSSFKYIE